MLANLINRFTSPDISTDRPIVVRNGRVHCWMASKGLKESSRGVWLSGDGKFLGLTWAVGDDKTACHVVRFPKTGNPTNVPKTVMVKPFRTADEIRQYGDTEWQKATEAYFPGDGGCSALVGNDKDGYRWVFCSPGRWRFER